MPYRQWYKEIGGGGGGGGRGGARGDGVPGVAAGGL